MRIDVRWAAMLVIAAGCSQPLEVVDSAPEVDTTPDDTEDTRDTDPEDTDTEDTDTEDTDTGPNFCEQVVSTPTPGTDQFLGDCVTEELKCGSVIFEHTNTGGSTHYNHDHYDSIGCANVAANWDAPERVYRFEQAPNSTAFITLGRDCDNDLDLRAIRTAREDTCVNVGYYVDDCRRDPGAKYGEPQIIRLDAAGNPQYYDLVVDGLNGTEANFTLEIECTFQ